MILPNKLINPNWISDDMEVLKDYNLYTFDGCRIGSIHYGSISKTYRIWWRTNHTTGLWGTVNKGFDSEIEAKQIIIDSLIKLGYIYPNKLQQLLL